MNALRLVIMAIFLSGCVPIVKDSPTFIQDGTHWNCVVLKEQYEPATWRQVRKGVCYEVKP